MSLHQLANHLQSAGRGEDKVLIHMTPKEVQGLQSLAMAHGGSLTINPKTGLPEAGILSSLLPTILGAGLAMTGVGAPMAALMVGGGYGLAKGSLKEGIMAGLGAYGGAGLGSSLAAAAPVVPPVGAVSGPLANVGAVNPTLATPFSAAEKAVTAGGLPGFTPASQSIMFKPEILAQTAAQNAATAVPNALTNLPGTANYVPSQSAMRTASEAFQAPVTATPTVVKPPISTDYAFDPISTATGRAEIARANVLNTAPELANVNAANYPVPPQYTAAPKSVMFEGAAPKAMYQAPEPSTWEKAQAGFKDVTSSGDKTWQFMKDNPGAFLTAGASIAKGLQEESKPAEINQGMIRPYDYTYGATGAASEPYSGSGERTYFNPVFTAKTPYKAPGPEYAADGGLMGLRYAVGGSVEQMSAENSVSANQMYPQSQFQTSIYSNPMMQRPQSSNVVSPSGDAGVDPYTGEAKFATGGAIPETTGGYKYDYNPQTQQFTQLSAPKPVDTGPISRAFTGMYGQPQQTGGGFTGMMNRAAGKPQQQAAPEAPIVSGGIAPPAFQPQQMESYQSLQQPINIPAYQSPEQQLGLGDFYNYMDQQLAQRGGYQGYAAGGMTDGHLGGYSDGGRLLKGPGDGVSDSIPAVIGNKQPARLADGEFVVPARIVSELGNGSTEAGAKRLYAMMERVQRARGKTTGKNKVAVNSKADKYLPA